MQETARPFYTLEDFMLLLETSRKLISLLNEWDVLSDEIIESQTPFQVFLQKVKALGEDRELLVKRKNEWINTILLYDKFILANFAFYGDASFLLKSLSLGVNKETLQGLTPPGDEISRWLITLTTSAISMYIWGSVILNSMESPDEITEEQLEKTVFLWWEAIIAYMISNAKLHTLYTQVVDSKKISLEDDSLEPIN